MSARLDAALAELVAALRDELRPDNGPDRLLGIDETAAALGIGRSMIYALLASGQLRSLKIGDRRLVPQGAIRQYVELASGNGRAGPDRDSGPAVEGTRHARRSSG